MSDSATPWTAAHQAALSMAFCRILQEYCSGLPFPTPGIEPMSPALADGFFTTEPPTTRWQTWVAAAKTARQRPQARKGSVWSNQESPPEWRWTSQIYALRKATAETKGELLQMSWERASGRLLLAQSGKLLEMHALRSLSRPAASTSLRVGISILCSSKSSRSLWGLPRWR